MRKLKGILVVISFFCTWEIAANSFANNLLLKDMKSNLLRVSTENRTIILDFWASWCESCINNMNTLNSFVKNSPKGSSMLSSTYLVSTDESLEDMNSFLAEDGRAFSALKNRYFYDHSGQIQKRFVKKNIPYLVVLKKGKIIYEHAGPLEKKDFEGIANLLGSKS